MLSHGRPEADGSPIGGGRLCSTLPPLMTENLLPWDELRERRVTVPRHVVHRSFAAETVLLNIQTGHYHGMDPVGGRFFETLIASSNVAAATAALAGEYEQPPERIQEDMAQFCSVLLDRGLIELAD